jgi:beta-galactosidase/beta-glucuronidase
MLVDLLTEGGEELLSSNETPWNVYPRPQMRRDSILNLNGQWEFEINERKLPRKYHKTIQLPFCPESKLSGLEMHYPDGIGLFYRRRFSLPQGFHRGRVLLHIGAADQYLECFVNDKKVGYHAGGYESMTFDITDVLQEENEIRFRCYDNLKNQNYPYGKQTLSRGGMWYTPVSGIWQTVWLESVPDRFIHKLNIENRGYTVTISTEPKMEGKVIVPELGEFTLHNGSVTITPENPNLWSPENPYLYDFTVKTEQDEVQSYFAIRSLEIKKVGDYPRLCLNGKPYFFHGLLDQGYWPDGIFTPAKPECFADDILAMKRLGFNTLRKHIKVEPEEFYYQCDKLGMIVFQDMVNNGDYGFFRDTALPTVGIQKLNDRKMHSDPTTRKMFLDGMTATVNQLKNHPCICYWTIFNEGWGQFDSDNVYDVFKKLDDTRFIDSTSGWFRRHNTDVDSRHVYFRKVKLSGDGKKPLVLSEFGGKTYKCDGHVFNPDKTYGYGSCDSLEKLNEAVAKLYLDEVLPCVKNGLCAAIYTQVSDVEDEINGLLSYDRKVCKLTEETMLPIAEALQKAIQ